MQFLLLSPRYWRVLVDVMLLLQLGAPLASGVDVSSFRQTKTSTARLQHSRQRAHPDLNQGPADLQSAALATEIRTPCYEGLSF